MGNHSEKIYNNIPKENRNNINKEQPTKNDKEKDEKPKDINIINIYFSLYYNFIIIYKIF